jgi:hypothetical protein
MRTLVTSQSAKKSVTSPSVASKERLPRWAVYGGFEGRGSSSRVAKPRSAKLSVRALKPLPPPYEGRSLPPP